MIYYIDIETSNNGTHIAGEMEVDKKLTQMELVEAVSDFAVEKKVCPRWAVDHCHWCIK